MPIDYLRQLSGHERERRANIHLGLSLAFIAGAMNAGGYLAIKQYTSHMSGIVSSMADALALADFALAAAALAAVAAFMLGAATTAIAINWAKRRELRSQYALSLLLEAFLLILFGLAGAYLEDVRELLAPATVLLLCYIMGLQNAIITKISGAEIRTTHVTGLCTDIGIELGKLVYINRHDGPHPAVVSNRTKLRLHATLLCSFFLGGVIGAIGFKRIGFSTAIPLALWLALMAMVPIIDDIRQRLGEAD